MSYKLGSLFDGSGGFPLSGTLCDIEPMWAAEVEPYPIAVTSNRFPNMKHLGDISKVNGAEIEPVDIITFGSPCQDLSVAGKRAGLKHEDNGDDETTRSGLFMEAVRIIKEMRKATNGQYPRFAVWENVPGAFSSNNGQDFRIVLEELIKVAEPYAVMPEVPNKGWAYADSFSGDGWSLSYRVFDAQYWGVPQRRRRIYLVADFRGGCAEKILFEREGLRGYFTESRTQGQTVTPDAERSVGADDKERVCYGISSYESNSMKSSNPRSGIYEAETSRTLDGNGGNPTCNQGGIAIVENIPYTLKIRSGVSVDSYGKAAGKGALIQENLSATLGVSQDQYLFQPIGFDGYNASETGDKSATLGVNCGMSTGRNGVITDTHILDDQGGSVINVRVDGKAPTLRAMMGGHPPVVMIPKSAEGLDAYNQTLNGTCPGHHDGVVISQPCHTITTGSYTQVEEEKSPTLMARDYKDPTCVEFYDAKERRYIVRRLTPTECARLQGFPDQWGHIEPKSGLTDDEYRFWLNVRKTHDAINGRAVKDYNEKQILTYYNKLWTDSAEYKMWVKS